MAGVPRAMEPQAMERAPGNRTTDPERRLAVREASTELLVELDQDSNVTDLLLGQHAKDPSHAVYSRKGPNGWVDVPAGQFLDKVRALAKGLIAGGPGAGRHRGRDVRNTVRVDPRGLRHLVCRRRDRSGL